MVTKAEAGYVLAEDTRCKNCQFLKGTTFAPRCAWMGPEVPVSLTEGGCNEFKAGDPEGVPYLAPYLTKIQVGYLENKNGFGCRRCENFKPSERGCRTVDKNSPGFTPGVIAAKACCDFWEKDALRGEMTEKQLLDALPAPRATFRAS